MNIKMHEYFNLIVKFYLKKGEKLLTLPINEYFFKKIIYGSENYRSRIHSI